MVAVVTVSPKWRNIPFPFVPSNNEHATKHFDHIVFQIELVVVLTYQTLPNVFH